ncbi:MAG TPA: pyridoxamine 5'-phosphate oxidase family protein [Acidimicrobiales bacterium]
MEVDRNGLEVLSRGECLALLGSATLGRIALTSRALPLVLPVNYRLDGRQIVIRTNPGTKLEAATRHTVVAFEVDDVDPTYHTGWSVVVQGIARVVVERAEIRRMETLPLPAWFPAADDRFVTISTDVVTGRRLAPVRARPVDASTMAG